MTLGSVASEMVFSAVSNSSSFHCSKLNPFAKIGGREVARHDAGI